MVKWRVMFDGKATDGTDPAPLYRLAIEQAAWSDARGVTELWVDEHHGVRNLPSPLAMAAGIGAVTSHARIGVGCLLLPLHDPIRAAEDAIVADLVSGGRLEIIVGLGYVPHEFSLLGERLADRARLIEERLPVFLRGLAGEPFDYRGRRGRLVLRPCQQPRPPVLVGGGVTVSARRAARLGDGFAPTTDDVGVLAAYHAECERLGRGPGPVLAPTYPLYVWVTRDPDRTWALVAPALLHEVDQYAGWVGASGTAVGYELGDDEGSRVAELRRGRNFAVLTPEECIALARRLPPGAVIAMKPTRSGADVDIGWESLELFADEVIPHIHLAAPAPAAAVLEPLPA